MSKKPRKLLGLWAALLALAFPAACGSSGVVGGVCSASHIDCNGQCMDAQSDPNHCGGCGRKCKAGVSCEDALCEGVPADNGGASGRGGNGGGGGLGEGGTGADSGAGGSSAASGSDDYDAGNLSDARPDGDAGCTPPYDKPTGCGECHNKCTGAKPNCAPYGTDEYVCVATCLAPLVECAGQCVEPSSFTTPDGCGACGVKCSGSTPFCSPNAQGDYACKGLCDAPLVECNGQCVDPVFDTAEACGACNAECPTTKPTCSPDGAGNFKCVLVCDAPLQECNGKCVDFNIDADNCGNCGNACASGICQGGMCVGASDGHVVLACMNFQAPVTNSAPNTLLGNAVLLPQPKQVRILAYTEFASAATRAKVDQHIAFAAAARGRSVVTTPLDKYTNASAALSIGNYEVFLIYEQNTAPTGQLATIGAAWQSNSVLASFAAAGGVIIGLSGGNSEMDQFFTSSQLLEVSAQSVVTGSVLYNRASLDSVGNNVISPFSAPVDSCTLTTSAVPDQRTVFVVRDAANNTADPVVVHRAVPKP